MLSCPNPRDGSAKSEVAGPLPVPCPCLQPQEEASESGALNCGRQLTYLSFSICKVGTVVPPPGSVMNRNPQLYYFFFASLFEVCVLPALSQASGSFLAHAGSLVHIC